MQSHHQSAGALLRLAAAAQAVSEMARWQNRYGRIAAALLALLVCGCAGDAPSRGQLRGTVLPAPLPRPQFTMPDLSGQPYAFAERTAGKLTFLFFGYTYCPDVCPIHMASLGAALRGLPFEDRARVEVVFVTVDPERDTPERLREWLAGFDARFTGLRGTIEEANAAAAQLNLPPAVKQPGEGGEGYTMGHAASVVAFSPDGPARVLYPFGTRREDWVHDLPLLLNRDQAALATRGPASTATAGRGVDSPQPVQPAGAVRVAKAFVTRSRMAEAAALYAVIENPTSSPEALIAVDAPAQRTELHETVREGEGAGMRMQMRPVARIEVPAGGEARLAPGGYHVMLLRPALEWQPGDTVTAVFRFASGAVRTVQARVVAPDDVARLLDEVMGRRGGDSEPGRSHPEAASPKQRAPGG